MTRGLVALIAFVVFAGPAWAADGAAVYDKKCKACHSIAGVGGPMAKTGGALDGVGSKRDAAWIKAYIKDPKAKDPNAKMPKMMLGDDDLDAVAGYLMTLKK